LILFALIALRPPATFAARLTVAEAVAAPYAPVVAVVDTISSLGPLAGHPQRIDLAALVRFHGHPCDGLVVAAAGIGYGLKALFPKGVVDRTDLAVAVNRSACYGDVAAYLTGARHRYGSLVVDPTLGDAWILTRRSTGQTVRVALRPGVRPEPLHEAEAKLKGGGCEAAAIATVQGLQRRFALAVLSRPAAEVFHIEPLARFPYATGTARPDTTKAACDSGSAVAFAPIPKPGSARSHGPPRVGEKITSGNSRPDVRQIRSRRLNEPAGVAGLR